MILFNAQADRNSSTTTKEEGKLSRQLGQRQGELTESREMRGLPPPSLRRGCPHPSWGEGAVCEELKRQSAEGKVEARLMTFCKGPQVEKQGRNQVAKPYLSARVFKSV